MTGDVIDALDEVAEYLELDGQRGRAAAYRKAANSIRRAPYIPPDPAELDGVGETIRNDIAEFQQTGEIRTLRKLKEKHPYYEEFKDIDGIGTVTAARLGDHGITTTDELREAINSGEVLEVERVGTKTVEKIEQSL